MNGGGPYREPGRRAPQAEDVVIQILEGDCLDRVGIYFGIGRGTVDGNLETDLEYRARIIAAMKAVGGSVGGCKVGP